MEIIIQRTVLEKNESAARENLAMFDRYGIHCINMLGGAGCGKTTVLETLLPKLTAEGRRCAVLEGDIATTRDAERIAALGVPVVQLLTEGGCHLTAAHVQRAMEHLSLDDLDLVFIENVGNPICPANFSLGEHRRISVLSVAEGDDKPLKYPLLFRSADLVLITKCDLLPYVRFNVERVCEEIRRLQPNCRIVAMDAREKNGVLELASWVQQECSSSLLVSN